MQYFFTPFGGLGPQAHVLAYVLTCIVFLYLPMYAVSGAKPQPPNVFLDIIGAYVSAGWGKVAVIFFCHTPKKWGYSTPSKKCYAYDLNT